MKNFTQPEINVHYYQVQDVICTSFDGDESGSED